MADRQTVVNNHTAETIAGKDMCVGSAGCALVRESRDISGEAVLLMNLER